MTKRFIRKNRKGVLHFIELNVRDFCPAFRSAPCARMALELLREHCDHHPAKLSAYVVMPTHLHIINNPLKARLALHANEYLYSSFNARYGTPGEVIVPIDFEFWWDDMELEEMGD